MRVWGMVALSASGPWPRIAHSACPKVPGQVQRSGRQGAGRGAAVLFIPLLTLCCSTAPQMRLQLLAGSLCISYWLLFPSLAVLTAEQIAPVPGVSQYCAAAYDHSQGRPLWPCGRHPGHCPQRTGGTLHVGQAPPAWPAQCSAHM